MMVITQETGIKEDLEATYVPAEITLSTYAEYEVATGMRSGIARQPVEYEDGSVILSPKYMETGKYYTFLFSGHRLLATKRPDDTIDFYYLGE